MLKLKPPNEDVCAAAGVGTGSELEVPKEKAGLGASSAGFGIEPAELDAPKLNIGFGVAAGGFVASGAEVLDAASEKAGLDASPHCPAIDVVDGVANENDGLEASAGFAVANENDGVTVFAVGSVGFEAEKERGADDGVAAGFSAPTDAVDVPFVSR